MKRKTLKRKISIVGILVFVSMIVYSCWQDEWSSNVTDEVIFDSNKELTIAKAEQWYNATNPSATTVRSLSADGRIPAKPNWNKAKESRKGDLEVVETTLMTSGSTFFMDNETKLKIEEGIVEMLKTVYDPEIPVNVYDLGLIYKIDLQDDGEVVIDMTLTAPNCPAADFIMEDIRQKIESVEGVKAAQINLVFEPEWDKDMMSEEAKLELGFL